MPKDITSRHLRSDRNRYHAYKELPKPGKGHDATEEDAAESSPSKRDWEDASCPICMEFPHNAVLLYCSSHDKGCRPYMCNTSYRHSNCLDQYQKAQLGVRKHVARELATESGQAVGRFSGTQSNDSARISPRSRRTASLDATIEDAGEAAGMFSATQSNDSARTSLRSRRTASLDATIAAAGEVVVGRFSGAQTNDSARTSLRSRRIASPDATIEAAGAAGHETDLGLVDLTDDSEQLGAPSSTLKSDINGLLCPLCRGKVKGWKVIQSAREHLNHKVRSCAQEACPFLGNYEELRVHARREHPFARPSEVDPARQRDWRLLERRRDLGDVMSTMMPGATVVGDFVIEDDLEEEQEAMDFPGDEGHWWTVFLLFQVFGPATSVVSENASRMRSRLRVPRRGLWGESLPRGENMQIDSAAEDSDSSELLRRSARRRRRRADA